MYAAAVASDLPVARRTAAHPQPGPAIHSPPLPAPIRRGPAQAGRVTPSQAGRLRRIGVLAIAALGTGLLTGALLGLLAGLLLALGAPAAAQPVAPAGAFGWPSSRAGSPARRAC